MTRSTPAQPCSSSRRPRLLVLVLAGGLAAAGAQADPAVRYQTLPNRTDVILGDAWTFQCPPGGQADILVDTLDDGDGVARVDPSFWVYDARGNSLLLDVPADDELECTVPTACGFDCAFATIDCGLGNPHLIIVRDGVALPKDAPDECTGGGYELLVEVFRRGFSVDPRQLKLGGGPKRKVPFVLDPVGLLKEAPLLDDEQVF
jgi:hypothetical protein